MSTLLRSSADHICCAPRKPSVFARLARARALYRQRRALRALDDAALTDLGLSRDEALAEARRPVWDAPQNWIK